MSDDRNITVYPGGLEEDPGPRLPLFLKLTYIGITLFGITYFVLYYSGTGTELVNLYNQLTAG